MNTLYKSVLFKGIEEQYITSFLRDCEIIHLEKGEFLFHRDELADSMFVVENGTLEILLDDNVQRLKSFYENNIPMLGAGAIIGELCVFGQLQRSASIRALEASTLLKIEGEDFRIRLYSRDLDALLMSYNIAKLLSERLTSVNTLLLEPQLNWKQQNKETE